MYNYVTTLLSLLSFKMLTSAVLISVNTVVPTSLGYLYVVVEMVMSWGQIVSRVLVGYSCNDVYIATVKPL